MASISAYKGGLRIQFVALDRTRTPIYLGDVTKPQANAVKVKVEALLAAQRMGHPPDNDVLRWVQKLSPELYTKLADVGLLPSRETTHLIPFFDKYIASRTDLTPATIKKYQAARDKLVKWPDIFQATTDLRAITAGKAKEWVAKMKEDGLSEASIRGFCRDVKTVLRDAVEEEIIQKSPFRKIASASIASPVKHYVPLAVSLDFLDRCDSLQWRIFFALARLQGLRAPSETHPLTYRDVDWEAAELTVNSPKTMRFRGKDQRIVPIGNLMMDLLSEGRQSAENDDARIVTIPLNNRAREFKRQLKALGIAPWPKMFQSLRASCEIQWLMEGHKEFAVSQWIGHSVTVGRKHYANHVPKEDYALFRGRASIFTGGPSLESGAQKVAHTPVETRRNDAQLGTTTRRMNRLSGDDASLCDEQRMSAVGIEPTTYGLKVRCSTN
jgi:integrase